MSLFTEDNFTRCWDGDNSKLVRDMEKELEKPVKMFKKAWD
jgi:hypothetical protein